MSYGARPSMARWCEGNWMLHDDCTLSPNSHNVSFSVVMPLSHPPYSPDLTLCDFFLFPNLKLQLKVAVLRLEEIQCKAQKVLDTVLGVLYPLHKGTISMGMVPKVSTFLFIGLGIVPQSDLTSTIIISGCYNHLKFFLRLTACSTKRPYLTVG